MTGRATKITDEPCPICGTPRRTIWLGRSSPYFSTCPNNEDEQHQAVYARWKREGAARRVVSENPSSSTSGDVAE